MDRRTRRFPASLAAVLILAVACRDAGSGASGSPALANDSLIHSDTSPGGTVAELHETTLRGGSAVTEVRVTFEDVRCGEGALVAAGGDLGLYPWWADDTTLVVFHPEGVTFQASATSEVVQCRDELVHVLTEPLACGGVDVVRGYTVSHAGHTYRIPGMLLIDRDGAPMYRDGSKPGWIPPLRSLTAGVADSLVLLRASESDCADQTEWTIAVIDPAGTVSVHDGWTQNWEDGFFLVDGELVYWSEWFCHPDNTDRRAGFSLVEAYSRADLTWTRREVPEADVCPRGPAGTRVGMTEPARETIPAR